MYVEPESQNEKSTSIVGLALDQAIWSGNDGDGLFSCKQGHGYFTVTSSIKRIIPMNNDDPFDSHQQIINSNHHQYNTINQHNDDMKAISHNSIITEQFDCNLNNKRVMYIDDCRSILSTSTHISSCFGTMTVGSLHNCIYQWTLKIETFRESGGVVIGVFGSTNKYSNSTLNSNQSFYKCTTEPSIGYGYMITTQNKPTKVSSVSYGMTPQSRQQDCGVRRILSLGDLITIRLDLVHKHISYRYNTPDFDIAFNDIVSGENIVYRMAVKFNKKSENWCLSIQDFRIIHNEIDPNREREMETCLELNRSEIAHNDHEIYDESYYLGHHQHHNNDMIHNSTITEQFDSTLKTKKIKFIMDCRGFISEQNKKVPNVFGKIEVDSLSKYICEWKLKIIKHKYYENSVMSVVIGVFGIKKHSNANLTAKSKPFDGCTEGSSRAYGYRTSTSYGSTISSNVIGVPTYKTDGCKAFENLCSGDIITMRLDLVHKNISFRHNSADFHVLFNDIFTGEGIAYRLAVKFSGGSLGCSVIIQDFKIIQNGILKDVIQDVVKNNRIDYNLSTHQLSLNKAFTVTEEYRVFVETLLENAHAVIQLNVKSDDMIYIIKSKICCYDDDLILLYCGKQLEDHHTLFDYDIGPGDVIYATYKQTKSLFKTITIRPLKGQFMAFTVKQNDTIYAVKLNVEEKAKIPPQQQRLIFQSKELNDDCIVSHVPHYGDDLILYLLTKQRQRENIDIIDDEEKRIDCDTAGNCVMKSNEQTESKYSLSNYMQTNPINTDLLEYFYSFNPKRVKCVDPIHIEWITDEASTVFGKLCINSATDTVYEWSFTVNSKYDGSDLIKTNIIIGILGNDGSMISNDSVFCLGVADGRLAYGYGCYKLKKRNKMNKYSKIFRSIKMNGREEMKRTAYGRLITYGDVITMRLDLINKTLSYKHNDISLGTAFNIISGKHIWYRSAVYMSGKGDSVTIYNFEDITNQYVTESNRNIIDSNIAKDKLSSKYKVLQKEFSELRSNAERLKLINIAKNEVISDTKKQYQYEINSFRKMEVALKDRIKMLEKEKREATLKTISLSTSMKRLIDDNCRNNKTIQQMEVQNKQLTINATAFERVKKQIHLEKELLVERVKQLTLEKEKRDECVVCLDNERSYACVPCGHLCLCQQCAATMNKCPLCQKICNANIKVFK